MNPYEPPQSYVEDPVLEEGRQTPQVLLRGFTTFIAILLGAIVGIILAVICLYSLKDLLEFFS